MTIVSRMAEAGEIPRRYRGTAVVSTRRIREHLDSLGRRLLNVIAPMGYEDELGFHYGAPPKRSDCSR
jgi:hypothetical protein